MMIIDKDNYNRDESEDEIRSKVEDEVKDRDSNLCNNFYQIKTITLLG